MQYLTGEARRETRTRIAGTGSFVPQKWVDNRAEHGDAASDLALRASLEALRTAGSHPNDLDCIVFATQSPDYLWPGSGCVLAAKLGLIGIAALDVRNQECGFLYGLAVADHFVRLGTYETVLVVGAEVMFSLIHASPTAAHAASAYGDGAGAILFAAERNSERGILACGLHSDGRFARAHMMPMPEMSCREIAPGKIYWDPPVFGGDEMRDEASRRIRESIAEALRCSGLSRHDPSLVIANVGNPDIAKRACHSLGLERARLYSCGKMCGDTAAASVPLSLDAAIRDRVVGAGDIVLLCSFGGGFTWAWAVLRI